MVLMGHLLLLTYNKYNINMKDFKSVVEGIWTSENSVITPSEKNTLISIYNSNKPVITKDPNSGITPLYELIQVDIALEENTLIKGLLNCRVDGEHTQIRF